MPAFRHDIFVTAFLHQNEGLYLPNNNPLSIYHLNCVSSRRPGLEQSMLYSNSIAMSERHIYSLHNEIGIEDTMKIISEGGLTRCICICNIMP